MLCHAAHLMFYYSKQIKTSNDTPDLSAGWTLSPVCDEALSASYTQMTRVINTVSPTPQKNPPVSHIDTKTFPFLLKVWILFVYLYLIMSSFLEIM